MHFTFTSHVHFRFMLDELIEIRMRRRGLARTNHARETGEMSRDSQLMTQVYRPSCLVPSPSLLSGCLGLPASHVVAGWPQLVPVSRCLVQSVIRAVNDPSSYGAVAHGRRRGHRTHARAPFETRGHRRIQLIEARAHRHTDPGAIKCAPSFFPS